MIDNLTVAQEALLKEYRDKVFGYAASTVTDKPKAEAAALRLTEGVMVEPEIHWATNPKESDGMYYQFQLSASLSDFEIGDFYDSINHHQDKSCHETLRQALQCPLWDTMQQCLWSSLNKMLLGSLAEYPFNRSYRHSGHILFESLTCGMSAFYLFPHLAGIAKHEDSSLKWLLCKEELNESCFAMYALPGHIILLEKPKLVKVEDGKLTGIEW